MCQSTALACNAWVWFQWSAPFSAQEWSAYEKVLQISFPECDFLETNATSAVQFDINGQICTKWLPLTYGGAITLLLRPPLPNSSKELQRFKAISPVRLVTGVFFFLLQSMVLHGMEYGQFVSADMALSLPNFLPTSSLVLRYYTTTLLCS